MPVDTWYDPAQHQRFDRVPDYKDVNPTDILGLFEAHQQRQRERAVKIAHKNYIEEKLQRCFMFYGVHSFKQHCRHLMEEFRQVKDELRGWKEDARLDDNLPLAGKVMTVLFQILFIRRLSMSLSIALLLNYSLRSQGLF